METQIFEIAIGAGREFVNPVVFAAAVLGGLALVTGVAERLVTMVQGLSYSRRLRCDQQQITQTNLRELSKR